MCVHMHEAELTVLELSVRIAVPIGWRKAFEPFGLEDAVDSVPVQVRQDLDDDEGEIVEREACGPAQRAYDGASLLGCLSGQLPRP